MVTLENFMATGQCQRTYRRGEPAINDRYINDRCQNDRAMPDRGYPAVGTTQPQDDFMQADVKVTHAQLLDLGNNAIDLIPAPGANKMIVPFSFCAVAYIPNTGYTGIDANGYLALSLNWESGLVCAKIGNVSADSIVTLNSFLGAAFGGMVVAGNISCTAAPSLVSSVEGNLVAVSPNGGSNLINQPFQLSYSTTPFTGGAAENYLKVSVFYGISDVS